MEGSCMLMMMSSQSYFSFFSSQCATTTSKKGVFSCHAWRPTQDCGATHVKKPIASHFRAEVGNGGVFLHEWKREAAGFMLSLVLWAANPSSSIAAADPVKTYTCVLNQCRGELARCILNPTCASNLACIETCNGRPEDADCQIGCGNLFQNEVVDNFNECVLSRKKCVSQRPDDGSFPAPSLNAVIKKLKLSDFDGKWYITSGLNPTFDTFDCQLHNFSSSANKLIGNLTWRVKTPDDGFITRSAVQNFVQDPIHPGLLYNHDNELLHYQEDWYVLSTKMENKDDDYIFIFYRGKNDAWSSYGGAIVYTRTKSLPSSIVPKLEEAARKAGLDFKKFQTTDNSCKPQPPLIARIGNKIKQAKEAIFRGLKGKGPKIMGSIPDNVEVAKVN